MDVKQYCEEHGMSSREVISLLNTRYPHYGKVTHCMVTNPEKYGVTLVPEAEAMLEAVSKRDNRTGDRHKNRHRISVRVTPGRYEEIKSAVAADGKFVSIQAFLDWWITVWLNRQKKAAAR